MLRNSFIPNEHNPGETYYIYLMLLVVEIRELVQANQAFHWEKLFFCLQNDHITYSSNEETPPEQHIFQKTKMHFL